MRQALGHQCNPSSDGHASLAHRESHLGNAIEEHLQGGEEKEARIQVRIVDAVWGDVSAKEQCCADDACEGCLKHPAINVSCIYPLK